MKEHQRTARSDLTRTRSWRGRSRTACARACGLAAVRQGTPSQVRCAAQNNARPLAPPVGARARPFSRARSAPSNVRSSALVTSDVPRLAAQPARSPEPFKPSDTASRARRDAGLGNRRKVEPVGDAFVAERRPVQSSDKRLDAFCDGRTFSHRFPVEMDRHSGKPSKCYRGHWSKVDWELCSATVRMLPFTR